MTIKLLLPAFMFILMSETTASNDAFEKACEALNDHNRTVNTHITDAQGKDRPIGVYQHYKGHYYNVLGTVQHTETAETLVLYQSMYPKFETWVRPISMFFEEVVYNNVRQARFKFIRPFPR